VDGDAPRVRRFGVIGVFVVVADSIVEIADADGAGGDFRSQRSGRVSEDWPILGDTLAALRDSTGCAEVEGGIVRSPVAVGDQEHRGHIRACRECLKVPVHDHRALRVAGQHDFRGRALRNECGVLLAKRLRAGIDAAHEAEPLPDTAVLIWHRHCGIVDRLSGHRAAVALQLRREIVERFVDHPAHAVIRGQIRAGTFAGACNPDPVHIRTGRVRTSGTGRQAD